MSDNRQTALPTGQRPNPTQRPVQRTSGPIPGQESQPAARPLQQRPPATSLVPRHTLPAAPTPVFDEIAAAQQFLDGLRDRAFVLSPVVKLDHLPEFYSLSVRFITVDPRKESGEVYDIYDRDNPGSVALTKVALDKIAGAAGISWHPELSKRLDDRSHPFYCHFRAVGVYRDSTGEMRTISGEKETDVRDGNPLIWKADGSFQRGWSEARLLMAREHILPLTESKARNRAIRLLGVRQKYQAAQLAEKPFVVLSLVLTGRSSDAEMQRIAKQRILDRELAANAALFGPVDHARALPAPVESTPTQEADETHPPPPAGTAPVDRDEDDAPPCQCRGEFHEVGCPENEKPGY